MIASESSLLSPRIETTQPVSLQHAVCCGSDAEAALEAILAAMRPFPFGVSDALAVQMSLREALHRSLAGSNSEGMLVRTALTPASIRIQIDDVTEPEILPFSPEVSRWKHLPVDVRERLQLARTYMTSVDVHQQGKRIVLFRARGQGSAVSSLPAGYDFQI